MWTIEPMQPAVDLDAVVAIEDACFTNPWTRAMFVWELENSDVAHFFVLRDDERRIAAYCSFWVLFDELHVNNLAVLPEYRQRGMATALLTAVLRQGLAKGARRATLEVRASNEPALRLYERLGFRVAGRRRDYYSNPREDALILWHDELERFRQNGSA